MRSAVIILGRKNAIFVGEGYVFFTSLLKRCDKGCLVVTKLRKRLQYFLYIYCTDTGTFFCKTATGF